MSTNRASTSKTDPRIAKKEFMVTRHKSAQMKRQLRVKDRSMKHLTDLLKSPTKETQTTTKYVPVKKKQPSPKAKQSLLNSVEKVQKLPQKTFKLSKVLRKEVVLIPDEEYYPNKLKRKLDIRKVVLKPKNALKKVAEIAGSVKRKCGIPSKAANSPAPEHPPQPASPPSKLSMAEAMSIMEEHLTDEDLMEILTCPSPVWWEDPPDDDYVEDALFTRPADLQSSTPAPAEPMEVDTENTESDVDRIILIPNLSEKSDKFLKKRSKLEDLLGCIKDKSNHKVHDASNMPNNDKLQDLLGCMKDKSDNKAQDTKNMPNNDKLQGLLGCMKDKSDNKAHNTKNMPNNDKLQGLLGCMKDKSDNKAHNTKNMPNNDKLQGLLGCMKDKSDNKAHDTKNMPNNDKLQGLLGCMKDKSDNKAHDTKNMPNNDKLQGLLGCMKDKSDNKAHDTKNMPNNDKLQGLLGCMKDKSDNKANDTKNMPNNDKLQGLLGCMKDKSDNKAHDTKSMRNNDKLQDLLGCMKDKSDNKAQDTKNMPDNDKLQDLLGCMKDKSNNDVVNSDNSNEIKVSKTSDSEKRRATLSESDDEIMFHNSSMNEDELLKDLENMNIPIADRSLSSDVIVIDDDDDDFLEKETNTKKDGNVTKENKINDDNATVISDNDTEAVNKDTNTADFFSNDVEVPKNLPALQKCKQNKVTSSPRSFDSLSSKSSVISSQDIDSISDTNVRFLSEDELDVNNKYMQDSNDKIAAKSNEILNKTNTESKELNKASDNNSVTVYKEIDEINKVTSTEVTNNEIVKDKPIEEEDLRSTNVAKLNDYYKKCKKINHKRVKKEEKTDINKNDVTADNADNYQAIFCDACKPSFKRVSEDENVKYCLNCSSIFDTTECNYCIRQSKNRTCSCACGIKFCCDNSYKTHTSKCSEQKSCREEVGKILMKHDNDPNKVNGYSVSSI